MAKRGIKGVGDLLPFFFMAGVFVLTDVLALLVTSTFESLGVSAFEDQSNPLDLVYFFVTMLAFTGLVLLLSKFFHRQILYVIFLGVMTLTYFYIFGIILTAVAPELQSTILSLAATVVLTAVLVKYPEWYVVDICGVLLGVGSIATFGVSLNLELVIILLIGMAIYDAVSVYRTKHMIDLADAIFKLKLPVMLVIPRTRNYSLIKETRGLKDRSEKGEEREAFFIGLGDIVFPGILFVAAFQGVPSNSLLIAFSVMMGTLLGLVALMIVAFKGKPQAGLPYLSSGAILGYVVSSYLIFGGLVGLRLF